MVRDISIIIALILLAAAVYGCREVALPEGDSPRARVYTSRCGICHSPPEPGKYPFGKWKDLLGLMEMQMEKKGLPPLGEEERTVILEYLKRYSKEEAKE